MDVKLDAIDLRILELLHADAKMRIKEVASRLNMTTTPVFARIKRLEKENVILKYAAILNRELMGYHLVAFCFVTLESHHKDFIRRFEKDIEGLVEVVECHHIAGMFDYLLKIRIKDMTDYQSFISNKLAALPNIGRVQSSFVMKEIKNEYVVNS